jgi:sterol desaturase/sphingolipid hydroxylase (fatty acid hydroxylase superfamily)
MESFSLECSLFFSYWGTVVLLCTIEYIAPQLPNQADCSRRWFTNFGLGILNGLIASSVPAVTIASAWMALSSHFGVFNILSNPWWLTLVATVLVRSLAQYLFHVLSHRVSLLWRLHRIHHSDVHLDVSSALRNHPLEMIASAAFTALVVVLFGLSPVVLAVFEIFDLFANILTHANVRIWNPVERGLRLLFVTPALHRLHLSSLRIEADGNYGNMFSFWDRAFGTYRGETIQPGRFLRFGLEDVNEESATDLQTQLTLTWST